MLIATKIIMSSPYGGRSAVHTTFCRSTEAVVLWAADKVRRFALRRRLMVLDVNHDVTVKVLDCETVAQALKLPQACRAVLLQTAARKPPRLPRGATA